MRADLGISFLAATMVVGTLAFIFSLPGAGELEAYTECAFQRRLDIRLGTEVRGCAAPSWIQDELPASADTHPKGGDAVEQAAPFMSGAVPKGDAQ